MGNTQSIDARAILATAVEKSLPTSDNYFIQKLSQWAVDSNPKRPPAIEVIEDSDDDVRIVAVEPPPSPILSTTNSSSSSNDNSFTCPTRRTKIRSQMRDRSFMTPYYRHQKKSLSKNLYLEMLCKTLPNYMNSKPSFKRIHPKRMESELSDVLKVNHQSNHLDVHLSKYNYHEYSIQKLEAPLPISDLNETVESNGVSRSATSGNNNDKWFVSFRKELAELERERQSDVLAKEKEIQQIVEKRSALRRSEVVDVEEVDPQTPPIDAAMKEEIQNAFRCPAGKVLISAFKLDVTRTHLDALTGLSWLNDTVINFYFNMIMARSEVEGSKLPKVYAFNSFFYTRLAKEGFKSVKRWTRRIDLFRHDIILVPVHLGVHWCLSAIDLRKKHILYYDSMGGDNNRCLTCLLQYLEDEKKDKKNEVFDKSDWECKNLKNLPQQGNGSDCGVFACKYADYVSRDAKINFTQEDMPYFRQRMIYEILKGKLL